MARFTDDFRAGAVLLLEAAGYPNKKGALSKVAGELNVSPANLNRWFNGTRNPPPTKLVNEKRLDLRKALKDEIQAALGEMDNARQDASYRDLGTVLGILFDKLQLLDGGPTANTNQKIIVEYADDADILTEAAGVAERRYQDIGTV